uniref:Phd finger protein, putative n=1 Tax=Schistosoma mansoni TaxID=6183 RepID=A0A3Q0KMT0_SCHMA
MLNLLTASTSRVQKRAYCPTPFMSLPGENHFLPQYAGYDLSWSSICEHSHENKKSRLLNPTSLVPLLRFGHMLVSSHPQIDCVNQFSTGNQENVAPFTNYTHQNIKRPRFMADKPDQYVQAFCSSTKPYVSSSNSSEDLKLSSNVPWSSDPYPLDYICEKNLLNTSFSSCFGSIKTPGTSTIIVSKLPQSVCVMFPNTDTTQISYSGCNSYASVSAHTSCSATVQATENSSLPFTHSSTNSSRDSKNISQDEEGTQNNLKASVFKHEPRKRKSRNYSSTVMVEVNTTGQTNSSFFHSNENIITKGDAKSTLNSDQEYQSSSCATTVPIQLTNASGVTPSTMCEQLSYPFSHNVITHTSSSVSSRPKCSINHAPLSSNAVRRSMSTSRRPILPNHLRKYPNTLLLNTRLGFKSVCNTAAIQSIHHIRSDLKPIPCHDRPPFTQYHRQNVSSAINESSNRKRKSTSTRENKPSILKPFIIASKTGSVVTSSNTGVITPSFKIDALPSYIIANFIPTNLAYVNTVYYSSPEEDFLWKSQFFGKKNAQQLIYTLIYLFAKSLHLRNSHQLHQLRFGLNSQLKVVYFNDNNDDEINNNKIKSDTSYLTLKDDPMMSSNKCINHKSGNSSLIYRPDSSCSLLTKTSITSMSPSSALSSSPPPRTTVTNVSSQKNYSYFDYLDENTPRDYTVKQNAKLQNKISRCSSISFPRSDTNEQQLMTTTTSSEINFIFDHNSVNNHERCIVCYHEFYVFKRLSSIGQSLKNNYFLTWKTNCTTENSWFNCRPIEPAQLATILRKIESTLAYTAVRIKQRKQYKINSLPLELGSSQDLITKSTSSRLSSVKNNLQQIKRLDNSCYSNSGNSPLNLVTRKYKNQTDTGVNVRIFKTSGYQQSNFQINIAHPTCLDYWPELTERARQSPWQCSDCKTCTVCNNSEYRSDLIICDACDKGFHIECHRPKLEESIDRSLPWVCASCQDEGYRVAIGTLPSGNNNQNYSSPNKTKESNDDLMKTPLKEINSSYEYIKTESKQEINESGVEENIIKSVESSPHSTVGQHLTTTTSNTICNENFPADINSTGHSSVVLTPTKTCCSTSPKLNESNNSNNNSTNISTNNNSTTCGINSVQLDGECLHENKSSTSIQEDATDNDKKTSPISSNSTSDLHLKSCLEDNNNNNNDTSNIKEIKNEIENISESNMIINGENQEIPSNNNRPTDVSIWSVDHVQQWLLEEGFPREAEAFYQQEIDGTCLLLMKRMDVLTELGIKLGPAVKIYERIKRFQSQCGSPT